MASPLGAGRSRADGVVRVNGIAEVVHVHRTRRREARGVRLADGVAVAGPVPVVAVRARRVEAAGGGAKGLGVRREADAGLVHSARPRGVELAGRARLLLAAEGLVSVL